MAQTVFSFTPLSQGGCPCCGHNARVAMRRKYYSVLWCVSQRRLLQVWAPVGRDGVKRKAV